LPQHKLILLEGIPGSGKSTLAQTLLRHFVHAGITTRWWYEEDIHHPVYIFNDRASLSQVLAELRSGRYAQVVARALDQWQRFADAVHASESVVLLDGCLFGYLTWTLFPLEVPAADIRAYLVAVERIIAPLSPLLIHLFQNDIAASFRRVFASRGLGIEHAYIGNVEGSPYGKQRGLHGFAGLVHYWTDYRLFIDAMTAALTCSTLAIDTTEGAWHAYEDHVLNSLDLPPAGDDRKEGTQNLGRYVGSYRSMNVDPEIVCTIHLEHDSLFLDGMPEVWPRTRLIPTTSGVFEVASLPIEIRFAEDAAGAIDTLHVTGPDMLDGSITNTFKRVHILE
jgi:thymidylate kinase